MAENSKDLYALRSQIAQRIVDGEISEAEGGRQMLELDREFPMAWFVLAQGLEDEGKIDHAEDALWNGLRLAPLQFEFYLALADLFYKRRDESGSDALIALGFRRLSTYETIPGPVAERFQKQGFPASFDFKDPETYLALAMAIGEQAEGAELSPVLEEILTPYRLLDELDETAPHGMPYTLIQRFSENSERCAHVLRSVVRGWEQAWEPLIPDLIAQTAVALLGEIAGPEVLEELLAISDLAKDSNFLHVHWAIWRLGQRFPWETLEAIRRAAPEARVAQLCGFAEQISLLAESERTVGVLTALLSRFSEQASDEDAPYLLGAVIRALLGFGRGNAAAEIRAGYMPLLDESGRTLVREMVDDPDHSVARLVEDGVPELTIEDICTKHVLMDDEEDLDGEEDPEDGEDEEEDETPFVKPERNDPCWCGSGKKYKKCHLASDEEEERNTKGAAAPNDMQSQLTHDLLDAMGEWQTQTDMRRSIEQYFDRQPQDIDPDSDAMAGFYEWCMFDYCAASSGRTAVEEFLRRRGANVGERKRTLLHAWREMRLGLYEVQKKRPGTGVELKNYFTGERIFVHDVNSSRSVALWDCLLERVQHFEGRYEFPGNGLLLPRQLVNQFLEVVDDLREGTGESRADFVASHSHLWQRTIEKMLDKQLRDLKLVNAEGDPIEPSSATYAVSDVAAAGAALAAVEGIEEGKEEDGARDFTWAGKTADGVLRPLGHLKLRQDGTLRIESLSRKRLADGRRVIEQHAGEHLRHLGDFFESQESMKAKALSGPPRKTSSVPPEVEREVVSKFKAQHYANWIDEPLPALGGKTPRETVKTPAGRREVDDLLKMMENHQQRDPVPFDFGTIRKQLGF